MSRLPSLKPSEVIRKLRKAGFVFDRHAKGSHEIWYNPKKLTDELLYLTTLEETFLKVRFVLLSVKLA